MIQFPLCGIFKIFAFAPYLKHIVLFQNVPTSFYWKSSFEYGKGTSWRLFLD